MFSRRFEWRTPPNALGELLERKKADGESLLDLTQANPTHVGLAYDQAEILAALARPAAMVYEPDPRGLVTARRSIADYYRGQGCIIDVEQLFLTASTSEAYGLLFKLLADPGDEVLIPTPGYPLLAYLARFEGLAAVAYPLRYDEAAGWTIDLEVFEALVTPRTRAVVVVSPNNPTGSYIKSTELTLLDAVCQRHDLALVVDEVFADYPAAEGPPERARTALGRTQALTFVLNGFSKMVALPQVKLGWIAVAGGQGRAHDACVRLEALLDFYLSVSTPVQHAVVPLLGTRRPIQQQLNARIEANSRYLFDKVSQTAHSRMLRREGGWYAIVEIRDTLGDEERVLGLLDRYNTLVHPGFFYDFHREGFVVVSLLPAPEVFRAGVANFTKMA